MARGPHLAREASCLVWPARSYCKVNILMERLISLWQIKRQFKPKPSFVCLTRDRFGFSAKTFFLVFTCFWGQIPETLTEAAPILCTKLAIIWSLILIKMRVTRNDFSPVNEVLTSKKIGQACASTTETVAVTHSNNIDVYFFYARLNLKKFLKKLPT